ncbi:hypothetical protein AVEN_42438-1, partial [Araneus ventricosus]
MRYNESEDSFRGRGKEKLRRYQGKDKMAFLLSEMCSFFRLSCSGELQVSYSVFLVAFVETNGCSMEEVMYFRTGYNFMYKVLDGQN